MGSQYDVIKQSNQVQNAAGIQESIDSRKTRVRVYNVTLTNAQAEFDSLRIDYPFKGIWIQTATDSNANISVIANSQREGQLSNAFTMRRNDFIKFEDYCSGAQIYWAAQSGKTMTIVVFIEGEVRPGSLISQISGGVQVLEGSSVDTDRLGSSGNAATVAVTTTAAIVLPANSARVKAEIYFDGPCWLGDSAVAVNRGIRMPSAGLYEWKNTGALYAIAEAGTVNFYGNEQE